jgi:S-methylmethionine-dependent homocysteine/selenocysteine methylase
VTAVTILDGPTGTELERRGFLLPAPMWSARAVIERPDLLTAIHRDYAAAGAQVHTAATFRTTARALAGTAWAARWDELAARAVALCRQAAGPGARVAGSLAPLEDCFTPALTPDDAALAREHRELAGALARAGCDLLLVETMPTLRELRAATRAAVATGLPVWSAVTLGPRGDFFDDAGLRDARQAAADEGARAFLLNCSAAGRITAALEGPLARSPAPPGLLLGAYANAIFGPGEAQSPARYALETKRWFAGGATLLGGCCGTGPAHVAAIRAAFPG